MERKVKEHLKTAPKGRVDFDHPIPLACDPVHGEVSALRIYDATLESRFRGLGWIVVRDAYQPGEGRPDMFIHSSLIKPADMAAIHKKVCG